MLDAILMVDQGTSPREILPAGFDISQLKAFDFGSIDADPIEAFAIKGRVGIVPVYGRLSRSPSFGRLLGISEQPTTDEIADAILVLGANEHVDKIVLKVNSGGGEIDGIRNVVEAIAEARERKPVIASIDGRAGSAAYWIASQANQVIASSGSLVGAIGAFAVLLDQEKHDENLGVRRVLVASGDFKGLGADGKVTPEYEAEVGRIVNALADQFVSDVSAARKTAKTIVSSKWATGQMWTAKEAAAMGLVDKIQSTRGLLRSFASTNDARGGIGTMSKEDTKVVADSGAPTVDSANPVPAQIQALTESVSALAEMVKADREDRRAADEAAKVAEKERAEQARENSMTRLLDAAVSQGRISGADREMYRGLLATAEDEALNAFATKLFGGQPLLAAGSETPPSESVAASIEQNAVGFEQPSEARLKAVSHPNGTVLNPSRTRLAEIGRKAAREVKAEGGDKEACYAAYKAAVYAASGQRMTGIAGGVGADPWDQ